MIRHIFSFVLGTCAAACVLAGCKGLGDIEAGGGPPPSPSASPTSTPTTAPCRTMSPNSRLVVVGMSGQIAATSTAPPFNSIAGYGIGASGTYPTKAQLIDQSASGSKLTTNNVVQFTNVESVYYSGANHSAVAFSGDAFPSVPYSFPSKSGSQTNTTIGSGFWSTGRIPPASGGTLCYSQVFTLKTGTYFFGDLDFYNTATSYRDALIVSSAVRKK